MHEFTWPLARLDQAVATLAARAQLCAGASDSGRERSLPKPLVPAIVDPRRASNAAGDEWLMPWFDSAAAHLGIEIQALTWTYADIGQLVHGVAPALLHFSVDGLPCFLALLHSGRRYAIVLTPDLTTQRLPIAAITHQLRTAAEAPFAQAADGLLASVNIAPERRAKVRSAMIGEQMSGTQLRGCWRLRLDQSRSIWRHFYHARLLTPTVLLLLAHFVQQLFALAGWWVIGQGALHGHWEWAWIFAWALLLYTVIPFQLFVTWVQSRLGLDAGAKFKTRLLYGTLRLEPEEIRHQGIGQFLGRIMESEAFETLVLTGGFQGLIAIIELGSAFTILIWGPGGWWLAGLFGAWVLLTLLLMWRYVHVNRRWVETYRTMTNDLVERMVGHRTRIAQEDRAAWHTGEDQFLARYLGISQQLDAIAMQLNGITNRGWQLIGLSALTLAFLQVPTATAQLALGIGGVMLAAQALGKLITGISSIAGILVAWEQVGPLFNAARRSPAHVVPDQALFALNEDSVAYTNPAEERWRKEEEAETAEAEAEEVEAEAEGGDLEPLLIARDVTFRYPQQLRPVLQACTLTIHAGERILLEGPSGGGKSTLAALLVGLRVPESGLLLLHGLDQATLGLARWRRRLAAAPQFHENHVLTETFAFNLLMGRRWPATAEDLAEAETVCRELGLGPLLERMPAGLQQMVGESGWQLSHGERSRLFIARALLQKADLIVLDESFAALDPANLQQAMHCVLTRAKTLLVIAHP